MPDEFATRFELNGLGQRVNGTEIISARHDEKIKSILIDAAVQKRDSWVAIGELRNTVLGVIVKMSVITGGIVVIGITASLLVQIYLK